MRQSQAAGRVPCDLRGRIGYGDRDLVKLAPPGNSRESFGPRLGRGLIRPGRIDLVAALHHDEDHRYGPDPGPSIVQGSAAHSEIVPSSLSTITYSVLGPPPASARNNASSAVELYRMRRPISSAGAIIEH